MEHGSFEVSNLQSDELKMFFAKNNESLPLFSWPFVLSGIENGLLAWSSLLLAFRSSSDPGNNLAVLSCVFKKAVKDVCSGLICYVREVVNRLKNFLIDRA